MLKEFLNLSFGKIILTVFIFIIFAFVPIIPCKIASFGFNQESKSSEVWSFCSLLFEDSVSERDYKLLGISGSSLDYLTYSYFNSKLKPLLIILLFLVISYVLSCLILNFSKKNKIKS